MADNIKTAVTLFLITLISGILLGGVYEVTKEPIDRANNAALYAAYEELLPGGKDYTSDEEAVKKANEALPSQNYGKVEINDVVVGTDDSGKVLGYVVTSTSNEGYGGAIKLTVGYQPGDDGKLTSTGISFLSISETAGLGMNAEKPEFKDQFKGKTSEPLQLTKSGNASGQEINAMSGATITSTAVTNAVNAANYTVTNCLTQQ